MAGRSRTSFAKRQKEIARMEKQKDKAARRLERKQDSDREPGSGPPIEPLDPDIWMEPGDRAGVTE